MIIMTTHLRLLNFMDTALRIPPLFVIDEILRLSCGFSSIMHNKLSQRYGSLVNNKHPFLNEDVLILKPVEQPTDDNQWSFPENYTDVYIEDELDENTKYTLIPTMGKVFCCFTALFLAKVVFLLSWSKLVKVYTFLFSLLLIILSYQANMIAIKLLTTMENSYHPSVLESLLSLNLSALWDSGGIIFCKATNYVVQAIIGLLFTVLVPAFHYSIVRVITILSFLLPTITLLLPLPQSYLTSLPVFTALLPLCILKYILVKNAYNFFLLLLNGYHYGKMVLHNYGLHSLLESEWTRLNVPNVLRTFWLIRTAQHVSVLLGDFMSIHGEYQSMLTLQTHDLFHMFKEAMIYGCDTCIALLGMTSIVSYIGHYIGVFFQAILMSDDDDERSMGTVCAILFFILAEQSGLTLLEGENRFIRLCRNFSFLFTAILHFTHNMLDPILMSLSASHNPVTHRHIRALSVGCILITLPCVLVYTLWNQYPLSTWLLAVSAFSVQVVVKTLVSLLIYSLFLIDAYRNNFWESLDDYVYYIRAFGNSVEFVFGILLFFTGAWIYFFESGGSIRAAMMCVHAYFNIWCEAKNGWSVFMKRRTAVNKINSLPEATQEELEQHSDVCAICFQDLQSAKITKCNHLFHSVCLRKWLYVQDSCPLCHKTLYKSDNHPEKSDDVLAANNGINDDNTREDPSRVSEEVEQATSAVPDDERMMWDFEDIEVILGEDMLGDGDDSPSMTDKGFNFDSDTKENFANPSPEAMKLGQPQNHSILDGDESVVRKRPNKHP